MFRHHRYKFRGSQSPQSSQVINLLGQHTPSPHCAELTDSLHVSKTGEKEPEEWPREGAYNLPRLVEAGVCPGEEDRWEHPVAGEGGVREGWAGPQPEEYLPGAQSI